MTLITLAALLIAGPSFAERTKTARPALATPPALEECEEAEARFAVGQAPDQPLVDRARDASGAAVVRVYRTGDAITQDIRADRLDIEVGASGRIVSARCR